MEQHWHHQPRHHDPGHLDDDVTQAARDARGRVVAAEGEHRASRALRHAAEVVIFFLYHKTEGGGEGGGGGRHDICQHNYATNNFWAKDLHKKCVNHDNYKFATELRICLKIK